MDKNTRLYYKSALDLKFHLMKLERQIAGFEVTLGKHRYFFRGGETPFNSGSSVGIASNKYCMNKILETAGLPMPRATAFSAHQFKTQAIDSLIKDLSFPLVVKPMEGTSSGEDVRCNINTLTQLKTYMETCYKRYDFLSVEEFHGGLNTYRVLIFYNKVIGVVERVPARVIGDGIHSIHELIKRHNDERERDKDKDINSPGYIVTVGPIKIDEEVYTRLDELQLTLDSVPKDKEIIVLCYTCNSSRGGTLKSLGKKICKENARLLCRAANVLGLNIVGFDVVCEDILVPIEQSRGVIIEANHNPDIVIHEHPMSGIQTPVTKKILRRLILKHPLTYCRGLTKHQSTAFYIRVSFVLLGLMAFWQGFLAILASNSQ